MAKFTKSFDQIVCEGDKISCKVGDIVFSARIAHDYFHIIDDDDMHNTDQNVTGCNGETQEEILAVRQAFSRGEWFYCGIVISALHPETGTFWDHLDSVWGIEANHPNGDNSFLTEAANEMLEDAGWEVNLKIKKLCSVIK